MENNAASNLAISYPEYPKTYALGFNYDYESAENFATEAHQNTNHLYDGYLPYEFHLRMAIANFHRFKHLVSEQWLRHVECAIWLHDVIEDTRTNYATLKSEFGEDVADLVYAVTNEKGKNRKERESDKYFEGIRNTPYATFVKLCDRLANVQYSKMNEWNNSGKLDMYRKEHPHFMQKLYDEKYKEMFGLLNSLLGIDDESWKHEKV